MSEWISVKNELPENSSDVVVINGNFSPEVAFYWDDVWYGREKRLNFVTHWAPLPELPKEEG